MKHLLISGYAYEGKLHDVDIYSQPRICNHRLVSSVGRISFLVVVLFKNSHDVLIWLNVSNLKVPHKML